MTSCAPVRTRSAHDARDEDALAEETRAAWRLHRGRRARGLAVPPHSAARVFWAEPDGTWQAAESAAWRDR